MMAEAFTSHGHNEKDFLEADLSRRSFLRKIAVGGGSLIFAPEIVNPSNFILGFDEPSPRLITRVTRPANLETPVSEFTSWITPNDVFFVRSHFGPPRARMLKDWRLRVTGDVRRPLALTLPDLRSFEEVTLPLLVQCAGNGRALFRPRVPGAQWEKGAVGNATWTGVRLRDVLQRAGMGVRAKHVRLQGADRPLRPQTPLFIRSIPIEKALDPNTLLAYKMNGEPLSPLHGAPLRIIVPGWYGDHCVKWLTDINLQEEEAEGFYMRTAYRLPKSPLIAGAPLNVADSYPLSEMVVKSLIAQPVEGSVLRQAEIAIQGVAFTGEAEISRVEVSTDRGKTWNDANLGNETTKYSWRLWYYRWTPPEKGNYSILSRATDSRANTQLEISPWNPGGYLWNGIDQVRVQVTA